MRNLFLDYFRGLAIIIVMIGHAIQINLSNNETSFVWNVILSFQMPLLFLISGYTAGLSYPTTGTKKAIINKVKKILLPYTIFAVFHYLVISIVTNNFNYIDLLTSLFESDFWFLRVLSICFLIIYITNFLQKRAVNNGNCIIQALFLLLSFLIIYFINILFNFRIIEPYYYLWFLVGLIIHLLLKGLSLKNKLIINLTRIIN